MDSTHWGTLCPFLGDGVSSSISKLPFVRVVTRCFLLVVRTEGVEPSRELPRQNLNLVRLPIPPRSRGKRGIFRRLRLVKDAFVANPSRTRSRTTTRRHLREHCFGALAARTQILVGRRKQLGPVIERDSSKIAGYIE